MFNKEKTILLLETAYSLTTTFAGRYHKYEEIRNKFNELISNKTDSTHIEDFDGLFKKAFPEAIYKTDYQDHNTSDIFKAVRINDNNLKNITKLKEDIDLAFKNAKTYDERGKIFSSFGLVSGLKESCISLGFISIKDAIETLMASKYTFVSGDMSKCEPPVLIQQNPKWSSESIINTNLEYSPAPKQGYLIGEALSEFAFFPKKDNKQGWDAAIDLLADEADDDEKWYYSKNEKEKEEEGKKNKPILRNYLSYTFAYLQYEDKIDRDLAAKENRSEKPKILSTNSYAAFNTGLVNKVYEPIYAIFKKNTGINQYVKQPWIFYAFGTANSNYQSILSKFPYRPPRAEYASNRAELLYDLKAKKPSSNRDHIIYDNISRLPIDFLRKGAPNYSFVEDISKRPKDEQSMYYENLVNAIKNNEEWLEQLITNLDRAIEIALKRVEWNYKTAIPVVYFSQKEDPKISILLPLALGKKGIIDAALVCKHNYNEKEKINNYEGKTIFTLQMAYTNARLISRPQSDWLSNKDN